ncbi:MAG TPA: DUF6702 family protein [Gemmatimonadales bacterium]|nr:DUF6702 family protein [Gemmatimonadales bacterium]
MGTLALTLIVLVVHPLHTTLTQLAYRDADRTVEVSVRVFADDFRAVVGHEVTDETAFTYLRLTVTLNDRAGRSLAITWCGQRRTGDVLWLCLRAPAPDGLSGLRVHVRVLLELYSDQINIVQATYSGRRASLLFSRGDPPRPLP